MIFEGTAEEYREVAELLGPDEPAAPTATATVPADVDEFARNTCGTRAAFVLDFANRALTEDMGGHRIELVVRPVGDPKYVQVRLRGSAVGALVYIRPRSGDPEGHFRLAEVPEWAESAYPLNRKAGDVYRVGIRFDSQEAVQEATRLLAAAVTQAISK